MKLLIATKNQGKLQDYLTFCHGLNLQVVSLQDEKIDTEFEEIYDSFEANARAKAEFYAKLSGLPTLADDSGIEIPYYRMAPGVKTKRWAGDGVTGRAYFEFILKQIKDIPGNQRQGQMRAVLALRINNQTHLAEGIITGRFTDQVYQDGFTPDYPWDPLFILDANHKYYEALTPEENLQLNHRHIAFKKLKPYLQ